MKNLISIFILTSLFSINKVAAQKNAKDSSTYFVVLYTTGEAWDTTKQFYDQAYFDEHSKFLSGLRKKKIITLGARYSDTGMIILKAKDLNEANLIMDGDLSVKNKLFRFELYEMDVFYEGCVE